MKNKHNPAKQLKKAGTAGQESTVFILQEENEQVEPINTLLLNQEAVKQKNQRARGHSTLLLTKKKAAVFAVRQLLMGFLNFQKSQGIT